MKSNSRIYLLSYFPKIISNNLYSTKYLGVQHLLLCPINEKVISVQKIRATLLKSQTLHHSLQRNNPSSCEEFSTFCRKIVFSRQYLPKISCSSHLYSLKSFRYQKILFSYSGIFFSKTFPKGKLVHKKSIRIGYPLTIGAFVCRQS
jgi:hypothetical protein